MLRSLSLLLVLCLAIALGNEREPQPGVGIENFAVKLQDACGRADRETINDLAGKMIGHLVGPPVVLPTPRAGPGGEDINAMVLNKTEGFRGTIGENREVATLDVTAITQEVFGKWCEHAELAMNVLRECPAAAEAFDTLAKITDVAFNFAQLTVNPNVFWLPQGQSFPVTNAGFTPFVFGKNGYFEKSYEGTIPAGGGAYVMKEFFGIKAIIIRDRIPIYQEAWYSRRRIIGWKWIYYVRYVPCEYIKSIIYQHTDASNAITSTIRQQEVCDTRLLGYWNFPLYRH